MQSDPTCDRRDVMSGPYPVFSLKSEVLSIAVRRINTNREPRIIGFTAACPLQFIVHAA